MPASLKFPSPSVTGVGQPDPQAADPQAVNPNADYPPGFVPPSQLVNPEPGSLATTGGASPMVTATPVEDRDRLAPVFGQMRASLPTDPAARARLIAQSLFPNLSSNAALSRFGYQNGRLIYQADDGKVYYAEPSFSPLAAPARTAAELPQLTASGTGAAITTIPAIGGGVLTEPFGGVPGAAAGGFLGDLLRQSMADAVLKDYGLPPENKTPTGRAMEAGQEGLTAGVGQLGGNVVSGLLGKVYGGLANDPLFGGSGNKLNVPAYDIRNLTQADYQEALRRQGLAQGMNVTITPGEASGLQSLLVRQRQLGDQPEVSSQLGRFYDARNEQQLPSAFDNYVLNRISPPQAPGVANRNLQQASEAVIKSAQAGRSAVTSPFYRRAESQVVPTDQVQSIVDSIDAQIAKRPEVTVLNQLQALRRQLVDTNGVLNQNIGSLDSIYKVWRDKLELPLTAANAVDKNSAALIRPILNNLQGTMEANSADIATGSALHRAISTMPGGVDELEQGTASLAAADTAGGYQNVPKTLFGIAKSDPMSIVSNRNAFVRAGKLAEWNAGVRSFLQDAFETATASRQKLGPGGQAPALLKILNAKQMQNLQAALAPDQFEALKNFMDVADSVSKALPAGSRTAGDIGAGEAFAGPGAKALATAVDLPGYFRNFGQKIIDVSRGENVQKLVSTITSPDSVQLLRNLRALPVGSKKWIAGVTQLAVQLGVDQTRQLLPDQPIGYLTQGTNVNY